MLTEPPEQGPTPARERMVLLDALRGFALFGVLLVNLRDLTLYSFLSETAQAALPTAGWDRGLDLAMAALVDAKAFTIFTLLFGVGFALQAEKAGDDGGERYRRRMWVLLAIGLVHGSAFWWGDILRLYAILGLVLWPLAHWRPRRLAWLGVTVAVFLTPALRPMMAAWLPSIAPSAEMSAATLAAFQGMNVEELWRANSRYDSWTRISAWGLPFYIFGRLLLGAALGRSGKLWQPEKHRRFWVGWLAVSLPVGVALTAFILLRDHGAFGPMQGWWRTEEARALVRMARSGASLALGFAYMAAFVLLFQRPRWQRWLGALAPVGRMALTNYVAQTLLAMGLFYGIGFGLGPRFGMVGILAAGSGIFAAQWMG